MNCQKAGDLLSAYIEGEVTGRQCEALEAHLGGCAGCGEELETLRSALALLAAPKQFVRPEGLLEEFKAKYLPEAEAAPAPRWGLKIPVLPKIEWPSLSRLMLPMGGMAAAAAAAALVVALHGGQPGASHTSPPVEVAQNSTASTGNLLGPAARLTRPTVGVMKSIPPAVTMRETTAAKPRSRKAAPNQASRTRLLAVLPAPAQLADRPVRRSEEAHRPARHRARHSTGIRYASMRMADPAVSHSEITDMARRHADVELSPELRWRQLDGQGGAIMHKAAAPVAEEGYAEASCKNVATGEILRSAAVSTPAEPVPAGPAGDGSSKND